MPPKSANHELYHLAEKGIWKTFRKAVSSNPHISSGLPLPLIHRNPTPASRPEPYEQPTTAASDPAFNPYWKRDARRNYPLVSTVTQEYMAGLLQAAPGLPAIAAQSTATMKAPETAISETESSPTLSAILASLPQPSGDILPPTPASFQVKKWDATSLSRDAIPLPNKDVYWPIGLVQ